MKRANKRLFQKIVIAFSFAVSAFICVILPYLCSRLCEARPKADPFSLRSRSAPRRGCSAGRAPSQLMPLARPATCSSVPGTSWRGELTPHSCRSHGNPLSSRSVVSRETSVRSAHDSARSPHRNAVPSRQRGVRSSCGASPRRDARSVGRHGPSVAVKIGQLARTCGQTPRKLVSWH